ncbi:MAG: AAA family ATPase [Micromonosporaceae bacterium]
MIVLNGPPGCGKSTLAQLYADRHPLALNLDIDRLRALIGRWRDDPQAAGVLARGAALPAARAHLVAGHDVVIPQFLARPQFLDQAERLGQEAGAEFHEVVLLDSKENALRRFGGTVTDVGRRSYRPPAALADLVRARDRSCRFPGCRHRAELCDLDHTVPFPAGRPAWTTSARCAGITVCPECDREV